MQSLTFISVKKLLLIFFVFACFYLAGQPYKVIAYYTGNGKTITQYPVEKLAHIIYSFLKTQKLNPQEGLLACIV